jgi:hypothetical protein
LLDVIRDIFLIMTGGIDMTEAIDMTGATGKTMTGTEGTMKEDNPS